jgi:hypothetical protein
VIKVDSDYNPLKNIFHIFDTVEFLNPADKMEIRRELHMGGVVPESDEEFQIILEALVDINPQRKNG